MPCSPDPIDPAGGELDAETVRDADREAEEIRRLVDSFPPLTPTQRERLALLLHASPHRN